MLPVEHPLDKQQYKLYDAQVAAFTGTPLHAALSTSECGRFNRAIFNRATLAGYWHGMSIPTLEIVTCLGEYEGTAYWFRSTFEKTRIRLTSEGKLGWVIAHEAAHILLMAGRPENIALEMHGKEYVAVYLWAVGALFGKKWSNRLKGAFREVGIESACALKDD
jgi:hypothetical protein